MPRGPKGSLIFRTLIERDQEFNGLKIMTCYFLNKDDTYVVATHDNARETMSGLSHNYHYFPQGTLVTCIDVYPVNHPLNLQKRLLGVFEDSEGLTQELTVTDVRKTKK